MIKLYATDLPDGHPMILGNAWVHVAKQVLASKVTYHATFIPIPSTVAKELTTCLVKFVSGAGPSLRPARQVFFFFFFLRGEGCYIMVGYHVQYQTV